MVYLHFMGLKDLLGLQLGRRDAILNIARSRHAIWVGLLLVFSAAMAREYDRHWLVADWWHLLLPFGASIAMAFVQFVLFWFRRDQVESGATFCQSFRAFLACFWMTAPLAWAYAIPYEHFLAPADAVAANLWTLAGVSLLRGVIICRVLQVIANVAFWRALLISALPAQVVLTSLIGLTPMPILQLMGGIRYTPEEIVVRNATGMILFETVFVGWAVIGASIVALFGTRTVFSRTDLIGQTHMASIGAYALPTIVSLALIVCLPWTQPPWQRAYQADKLVRNGDIPSALAFMNQHPRTVFPPDWRPLPKTSRYFDHPNLIDMLKHIEVLPSDAWPRRYYLSELERAFLSGHLEYLPDDMLPEVIALLDQLPDAAELKQRYAVKIEEVRELYGLQPATTQSTQPSTP